MSFIATAIVGAAVIGSGAAIYGATQQSKSASNALAAQQGMFNQAEQGLSPFQSAGAAALPQLSALTGTGPQGGAGIQSTLNSLPGYQFTRQQGLEATQSGYAAQGLGSSGAAMKGAGQYATGLASSNLGQYYNMLLGQANLGSGAATAGAQTAAFMAGGIANSTQNIGNAQALGANGVANSLTGGANSYAQYSLLSQLMGSKGGGAVSNTNQGNGFFGTGFGSPELGSSGWPGTT